MTGKPLSSAGYHQMQARVDAAVRARRVKLQLPTSPVFVRYSAFGRSNEEPFIDNLDELVYPGKAMFEAPFVAHWMELCQVAPNPRGLHHNEAPDWLKRPSAAAAFGDYQSAVVYQPTWLDVAVLADDMIRRTGDFHHVFLEGLAPEGTRETPHDGSVRVFTFVMGS